jgi:hypothetical protein
MSRPPINLPPRLLRTVEAARFLGLSPRTLEKHRSYTGPLYRKLGGVIVYPRQRLVPSVSYFSSRFRHRRAIAAVAHFREQSLVHHAGQVATMNANVGQILRPDLTLFQSEGDRALSQGWFGAAGQPNPLGTVAVTLPHLDGGFWRSLAGNIVFVVRGFFGPGEPASQAARQYTLSFSRANIANITTTRLKVFQITKTIAFY